MASQFLKVEGHPGLVRDLNTGAIVVPESTEYREFVKKRQELSDIKRRLCSVEVTLSNIQSLLEKLTQ